MSSAKFSRSITNTYVPPHQRNRKPNKHSCKSVEKATLSSRDTYEIPLDRRHFLYGQNTYKGQWKDIRYARLAEEAKVKAEQICDTCDESPCMCKTESRVVNGRTVTIEYIENSDKWLDDNNIYLHPNCGQVCDCGVVGGGCICDNEDYSDCEESTRHRTVRRQVRK